MEPGDELGERYRLEERIGRGAFGEVWRGLDQRLHRLVAIKVLLSLHSDDRLIRRFRREALIAAGLQHPGIAVVHDVDRDGDQWFIVMELLVGRDLSELLATASAGLPIAQVISMGVQIGQALATAHARGVVHRDLKPSNLFMIDGQVKICDFGIAWAAHATSFLTAKGEALGTPHYMAPEQWRGERVDARADLYSFGCVLHALLTGRPPFAPGGLPALMHQHLAVVPDGPRAVRSEVPAELDVLVVELLAKDPADRPADADAVVARLERIADLLSAGADTTVSGGSARPGPAAQTSSEDRFAVRRRLIDDAEDAARSIGSPSEQARTLIKIAAETCVDEPGRVSGLIDDAERLIGAADDAFALSLVWLELLTAWPAIDDVITAERARGLLESAENFAHADPDREYFTTQNTETLLERIACAWYPHDPVRAEKAARGIPDPARRQRAIGALADTAVRYDTDDAERLARTLDPRHQAEALAHIAARIAAYDPVRAGRILKDAERALGGVARDERDGARASVAYVLAAGDLAKAPWLQVEAKRLIEYIPGDEERHRARARLAKAIAAHDPETARTNLTLTELGVDADISSRTTRDLIKFDIGEALIHLRSPEAERAAFQINDCGLRGRLLLELLPVLADVDADRAERLAHHVHAVDQRAVALALAARAVAVTDPGNARRLLDGAERLADVAGGNLGPHPGVFEQIAAVVATYSPDQAERIITSAISDPQHRAHALSRIAEIVAEHDTGRAERIARTVTEPAPRATALLAIARVDRPSSSPAS
ncbi:hypothetical protein GCM10023196_015940 [Actinoallomurus vinaceus]|uniref:non-specific serine/threonine protein kinase n=1 Tax=Actinoallomurus vinaceus TaxID=1080074 RepID=A0ABP8U5C6_9ACTN